MSTFVPSPKHSSRPRLDSETEAAPGSAVQTITDYSASQQASSSSPSSSEHAQLASTQAQHPVLPPLPDSLPIDRSLPASLLSSAWTTPAQSILPTMSTQAIASTSTLPDSSQEMTAPAPVVKRGRGRPKGSKNIRPEDRPPPPQPLVLNEHGVYVRKMGRPKKIRTEEELAAIEQKRLDRANGLIKIGRPRKDPNGALARPRKKAKPNPVYTSPSLPPPVSPSRSASRSSPTSSTTPSIGSFPNHSSESAAPGLDAILLALERERERVSLSPPASPSIAPVAYPPSSLALPLPSTSYLPPTSYGLPPRHSPMLSSHPSSHPTIPLSHLRPLPAIDQPIDLNDLDFSAFERVLFDVQQLARVPASGDGDDEEEERERRMGRPIVLEEGWDEWVSMRTEQEMGLWERVLGEVKRRGEGEGEGEDEGQEMTIDHGVDGDRVGGSERRESGGDQQTLLPQMLPSPSLPTFPDHIQDQSLGQDLPQGSSPSPHQHPAYPSYPYLPFDTLSVAFDMPAFLREIQEYSRTHPGVVGDLVDSDDGSGAMEEEKPGADELEGRW